MMLRRLLDLLQKREEPPSAASVPPEGGATEGIDPFGRITGEAWRTRAPMRYLPRELLAQSDQGIPVMSVIELLEANRSRVDQALDGFQHKDLIEGFDDLLLEMIRRVAHWMGPFPGSKQHHHFRPGGLFAHSLSVAVLALNMSVSKNLGIRSSPRERDADILAWQLVAFICGLLHDIGKIHTVASVRAVVVATDPGKYAFQTKSSPTYLNKWEPFVEGFENWARNHRVEEIALEFEADETIPHFDYNIRYYAVLVPRPLLAFIYASNPLVKRQFEDFMHSPNSGARTPVFEVVNDADHHDVALSTDPRRMPGSIELSSLVLRRFNEYASEVPWNLPGSPFIYARVQVRAASGVRFIGLPFFVATESNISRLEDFIHTRPHLGVSFGPRMTELIFNSLEKVGVLSRTLDGLLPKQIEAKELPPYVPASMATVRFQAQDASMTAWKGETFEDYMLSLPVVPITIRASAEKQLSAPTLAFGEDPVSGAAAVVPAEIQNGEIVPQDKALRDSPAFIGLRRAMAVSRSADSAVELSSIQPAWGSERAAERSDAARDPAENGAGGGKRREAAVAVGGSEASVSAKKRKGVKGARGADLELPLPLPEPQSEKTVAALVREEGDRAGDEAAPPTRPLWLEVYAALSDEPAEFDATAFWAVVWLHLHEEPFEQMVALTVAPGIYAIRSSEIPMSLRERMMLKIREEKISLKLLIRHWPHEPLTFTSDVIRNAFKVVPNAEKGTTLRLKPQACEFVEGALERQAEAIGRRQQ